MGKGSNDAKGREQPNNSERVFAAMMSDQNFKTNFNFTEPKGATGPHIEEIDEDDLD